MLKGLTHHISHRFVSRTRVSLAGRAFLAIGTLFVATANLAHPREMVAVSAEDRLVVPPIREDRPRLMFTPESLALMKKRIAQAEEPWLNAAHAIIRDAARVLDLASKPNTGRNARNFYDDAVRDGERARLLAYAWLLSGDETHASASLQHLAAWASAKPSPASDFDPEIRFANAGMMVARAAIPFLEAYDLLAEHPALSKSDRDAIEAWFRLLAKPILSGKRRWQENDYFNHQDFQNHLTAHTMGLAAIGYVLGDREMVQFALDHPENDRDLKALIEGTILMEGKAGHHREPASARSPRDGEIYDRYRHFTAQGRGIQYAHLSLSQLLYTAELAWNNGIDFYRYTGSGGENLKLPLLFYAGLFRTDDLSEANGVFAGEDAPDRVRQEKRTLEARRDFPLIYEVGNRHYPNTPEIVALLETLDRVAVPRHQHASFFYPILTHGEELDQ